MSYKNLDIWIEARQLVIEIHEMSLTKLPAFERFEQGNQIRRSIKSVKANIVEGYGRRYYSKDYLRFLIYAQASLCETIDHLETLYETASLKDDKLFSNLHQRLNVLGRKLNRFINAIKKRSK